MHARRCVAAMRRRTGATAALLLLTGLTCGCPQSSRTDADASSSYTAAEDAAPKADGPQAARGGDAARSGDATRADAASAGDAARADAASAGDAAATRPDGGTQAAADGSAPGDGAPTGASDGGPPPQIMRAGLPRVSLDPVSSARHQASMQALGEARGLHGKAPPEAVLGPLRVAVHADPSNVEAWFLLAQNLKAAKQDETAYDVLFQLKEKGCAECLRAVREASASEAWKDWRDRPGLKRLAQLSTPEAPYHAAMQALRKEVAAATPSIPARLRRQPRELELVRICHLCAPGSPARLEVTRPKDAAAVSAWLKRLEPRGRLATEGPIHCQKDCCTVVRAESARSGKSYLERACFRGPKERPQLTRLEVRDG